MSVCARSEVHNHLLDLLVVKLQVVVSHHSVSLVVLIRIIKGCREECDRVLGL